MTRYGPEVRPEKGPATSYAACKKNEVATGGGYDFIRRPTLRSVVIVIANRESLLVPRSEEELEELEEEEIEELEAVYPAPKGGAAATGWAVSMEATGDPIAFRATVSCAGVGAAGSGKLSQANEEGQQVLQLLR